ncbi:MAG: hypothetical protein R3F11_03695 [Verrucomicrobiales bacterium]
MPRQRAFLAIYERGESGNASLASYLTLPPTWASGSGIEFLQPAGGQTKLQHRNVGGCR